MRITNHIIVVTGAALCAAGATPSARAFAQAATAVPVVFADSIDASRTRVGDVVKAKTMQKVLLPDGVEVPKGATVAGHVTVAEPFSFNPAPYATQRPSVLGLRFEQLSTPRGTVKIVASVRALAAWSDSQDAKRPRALDEHDTVGTMYMIGGGSYRGDAKSVTDGDGNVIAYIRRDGVFARLLESRYSGRDASFECHGSGDAEQSIAIFSPRACGIYGMRDVSIVDNGANSERWTLRLQSRGHTVKLYGGTTALLEVVEVP